MTTTEMDAEASPELVLTVVADMRDILEVSPETRERARHMARVVDLDESVLWSEWINQALGTDLYEDVVGNCDSEYLEWLKVRVTEPFRVSAQMVSQVCDRFGPDIGMKLAYVTWAQEIAWAHRMRLDPDAKIAVLSHLFVLSARKDPSKEYGRLADYYGVASTVFEYLRAPEHDLTPEQIRAGYGSSGFDPLFMRYVEATQTEKINKLSPEQLEAMAVTVRSLEEAEMQKYARERALTSLRNSTMIWMSGIIVEAMEVGLDSDGLLHALRSFVGDIEKGEVPLPSDTGLPYTEFISWLRATMPDQPEPDVLESAKRRRTLLGVVGNPKAWLKKLPKEYHSMGANQALNFRKWVDPIALNQRHVPEDLVLDYGFFLVGESFMKS